MYARERIVEPVIAVCLPILRSIRLSIDSMFYHANKNVSLFQAADTLTQLGLLWSARGYSRRSILYLLASVGFLREASSSLSCASPTPYGDANKESGRGEERQGTREEEEEGHPAAAVDGEGGGGGGAGGDRDRAALGRAEANTGEEGDNGTKGDEDVMARKKIKDKDKEAKLESMLTHAFYYLAQVSGAGERRTASHGSEVYE